VTGYFIDPDGNETIHEIKENAFWINGRAIHTLSQPMYQLINDSPKVAVLIDKRVMSSGEAVAISFKKRSNTKYFGTPTCGLSTVNRNTLLRNGGMLVLTVSTMADREKEMYGDAVQPDITIENPADVVPKAIEWLNSN
jgi:C-terminal processing protease CtpA/Prc